MKYKVVVCPDKKCRAVSIVEDKQSDSTKCRKCSSQYKSEKYKVSYRSDNREDAVAARTKLLMKMNDDDMSFEEVKEKGYLDSDKAFSETRNKDTREPKVIVRHAFDNFEEPSKKDIIEQASKSKKMDAEKAEKAVKAMIQQGEILDYGDKLKLI